MTSKRDPTDAGRWPEPVLVREVHPRWEEWIEGWRWLLMLKSARVAFRPAAVGFAVCMVALLEIIDGLAAIGRDGARAARATLRLSGHGYREGDWGGASGSMECPRLPACRNSSACLWNGSRTTPGEPLPLCPLLLLLESSAAQSRALPRSIWLAVNARNGRSHWASQSGMRPASWVSCSARSLSSVGLALLLMLIGAATLTVPYVNIVGAIGYGLVLILGLLCVLAGVVYTIGAPLLVPAVACEGTDAVDSLGRVFPYVLGRPLRLLACIALLVLVVSVIGGLAGWAASATVDVTARASGAWAGPTVREGLGAAITGVRPPESSPAASGSWSAVGPIIHFWHRFAFALAAAIGVASFFSASTACYLLMRLAVDGQDPEEIWSPGEIEASMRRTEEARRRLNPTLPASTPLMVQPKPDADADA
jgi:hypothetical protein